MVAWVRCKTVSGVTLVECVGTVKRIIGSSCQSAGVKHHDHQQVSTKSWSLSTSTPMDTPLHSDYMLIDKSFYDIL